MSRLPATVQAIFSRLNRTKPYCACYYIPNPNHKYIQSRNVSSITDVSKLEHIYHGSLANRIWWLKILSWNTTGIFYVSMPVMFYYYELSSALKTSFFVMGLLTTATPIFGHILFRKYSIDLYYNAEKDVYTVTFYSLFGNRQYMEFAIPDIKRLGIEVFSTVKIKNRPLFFDPLGFSDVEHYKRMLGYDKPIAIAQEKGEIESVYKELQGMREVRAKAAALTESKLVGSVNSEEDTQKTQKERV